MVVKVSAPASTANLGPGFDSLGAALSPTLELEVVPEKGRWEISIPGTSMRRPDLVLRAAEAVAGDLPALSGSMRSEIPVQAGLGSSAAAVASGLLLGCVIAGRDPDAEELLQIGATLEGHADNLAAALYGGLTLVVPTAGGVDVLRFKPAPSVRPFILLPRERLSTTDARRALPEEVPLSDAIANTARASGLVAVLSGGVEATAERLWTYTQDRLHTSYRAPLMPRTAEALERLRGEGVAAVLSGAGPAILCLVAKGEEAGTREIVAGLKGWELRELEWSTAGARITKR